MVDAVTIVREPQPTMVSFKKAWDCHHCTQHVEAGEEHDCWTTTEAALTDHLSEELREAWERIRETAVEFGDQRIYASGSCIMFSRKACYFFVRPKRSHLEVCIFLGRRVRAAQIRRSDHASRRKVVHILRVTHRDEIESPITDWMHEAYETSNALSGRSTIKPLSKGSTKDQASRKKRRQRSN